MIIFSGVDRGDFGTKEAPVNEHQQGKLMAAALAVILRVFVFIVQVPEVIACATD